MVNVIVPDNYPTPWAALTAKPLDEFWDLYIRPDIYVPPRPTNNSIPMIGLKPNLHLYSDGIGKPGPNKFPPCTFLRSKTVNGNLDCDILGTPVGVPLRNVLIENITSDGNAGPTVSDILNTGGSALVFSKNMSDLHKGIIVRNSVFRRARANIGGRNLHGESWADFGAIIENCYAEIAHTNLTFLNSAFIKVLNNDFRYTAGQRAVGTGGDSIFPQATSSYLPPGTDGSCHDWLIESNYTEDTGDTAIDFTSGSGSPPHYNMIGRFNRLVKGSVRISGAQNVRLENNRMEGGETSIPGFYKGGISTDSGQGQPVDTYINKNTLGIVGKANAIRFSGAKNIQCRDNILYLADQSILGIVEENISGTRDVGNNSIFYGSLPPLPPPAPIPPQAPWIPLAIGSGLILILP